MYPVYDKRKKSGEFKKVKELQDGDSFLIEKVPYLQLKEGFERVNSKGETEKITYMNLLTGEVGNFREEESEKEVEITYLSFLILPRFVDGIMEKNFPIGYSEEKLKKGDFEKLEDGEIFREVFKEDEEVKKGLVMFKLPKNITYHGNQVNTMSMGRERTLKYKDKKDQVQFEVVDIKIYDNKQDRDARRKEVIHRESTKI